MTRVAGLFFVALLLAVGAMGFAAAAAPDPEPAPAAVKVKLAGADETVALEQREDGSYRFVLRREDGGVEELSPEAFARRVYQEQAGHPLWLRFLNITSPAGVAWIGLGLLGQVLFTGRMVIQWLTSEKEHRSVVPTAFWWMSLVGASMLITYFIWRKDVVGFLGQATGWLIYIRNLWLIYAPRLRGGALSTTD